MLWRRSAFASLVHPLESPPPQPARPSKVARPAEVRKAFLTEWTLLQHDAFSGNEVISTNSPTYWTGRFFQAKHELSVLAQDRAICADMSSQSRPNTGNSGPD